MSEEKFKNIKSAINDFWKKIKNDGLKKTFLEYKTELHNYFIDLRYKLNNLQKTNFELALYHLKNGNIDDAIFRFHILKKFFRSNNSEYIVSEYYLGKCYFDKLKYDKAKKYFLIYLESGHKEKVEEANFCLKIIDGDVDNIDLIPLTILTYNFDAIANGYDDMFFNNQKSPYQNVLYNLLLNVIKVSNKLFANDILDIGCGTGIVGKICRRGKIAGNITGIDISSRMLHIASELKIDLEQVYNHTIHIDVITYLDNYRGESKYDIIILSNVLTYLSSFAKIIEKLKVVTTESSILAFTFRIIQNQQKDWVFAPRIEEFLYNPQYIEKTLQYFEWYIVDQENIIFPNGERGIAIVASKTMLILEKSEDIIL